MHQTKSVGVPRPSLDACFTMIRSAVLKDVYQMTISPYLHPPSQFVPILPYASFLIPADKWTSVWDAMSVWDIMTKKGDYEKCMKLDRNGRCAGLRRMLEEMGAELQKKVYFTSGAFHIKRFSHLSIRMHRASIHKQARVMVASRKVGASHVSTQGARMDTQAGKSHCITRLDPTTGINQARTF